MPRLNRFETVAFGLTLATTVAACGSASGTTPNQPPARVASGTASPESARPMTGPVTAGCDNDSAPQVRGGRRMRYTYESTQDVDSTLRTVQEKLGLAAVNVALHNTFIVRVGTVACTVRLGIPQNPAARQQAVVFVGNSAEGPTILEQLGIPVQSADVLSSTHTPVSKNANGALVQEGASLSIIGQEMASPDAYQNAVSQYCQGLEVDAPQTSSTTTYSIAKEGACTAIAFAADNRWQGTSYQDYETEYRHTNKLMGPANRGLTVQFPLLTLPEYNSLPS